MALRFPPRLLFKSLGIGIVTAILLGAAAFALAPLFDAVAIYIAPARLIVPVIGPIIPSQLMDWMVPGGGAPAGVLLILISTILFWGIISGAVYFGWIVVSRRGVAIAKTNS
jgi:hypothetical protein